MQVKDALLKAGALAVLAHQFDVGEELHFDGDGSIALAGFAAATRNVEGKMSGRIAAAVGFGGGSEQLADDVERLDVGDRIRARRASDGRLIDQDDLRQ